MKRKDIDLSNQKLWQLENKLEKSQNNTITDALIICREQGKIEEPIQWIQDFQIYCIQPKKPTEHKLNFATRQIAFHHKSVTRENRDNVAAKTSFTKKSLDRKNRSEN